VPRVFADGTKASHNAVEVRSGGVERSGVVSASACGSGCGTRLLMETLAIYQHVALDGDLEAKYQATMRQIEL
jgi:hypothetical protein